jgi:hypothetical protein
MSIPGSPLSGAASAANSYNATFAYTWTPYSVGCGGTVAGTTAVGARNIIGNVAPDHFYAFTAPYTGVFTFATCNSAYDTAVAVWTAGPGTYGVGSLLGSCDDGGCTTPLLSSAVCSTPTRESVTARLSAGLYVIQIEGFSGNAGAYQLQVGCASLSPTRPPTNSPTTRAPTHAPTGTPTTRAPTTRPTVSPTLHPCDPTIAQTTCDLTTTSCAVELGGQVTCVCNVAAGFTVQRTNRSCMTAAPTASPTPRPTGTPTRNPTASPTAAPIAVPTVAPTARPTKGPTAPTESPTSSPTFPPTTLQPTVGAARSTGSAGTGGPSTLILITVVVVLVVMVLLALVAAVSVRRRRGKDKDKGATMVTNPITPSKFLNPAFDTTVGTSTDHRTPPPVQGGTQGPQPDNQYGVLGAAVAADATYARLNSATSHSYVPAADQRPPSLYAVPHDGTLTAVSVAAAGEPDNQYGVLGVEPTVDDNHTYARLNSATSATNVGAAGQRPASLYSIPPTAPEAVDYAESASTAPNAVE